MSCALRCATIAIAAIALSPALACADARAAETAPLVATTATPTPLLAQLLELRDAFIAQIRSEGFAPKLPPPNIVMDNPPSFGMYEDDKNLLHIAQWSTLDPGQQDRFSRMAKFMGKGQTPEQAFEDSVHHWVFVHELGHWWQANQGMTGRSHYSVEYGANRIAAAFWRLKDPALMKRTEERMQALRPTMPDPLPPGTSMQAYFNENYETLGPTRAYIWFQYSMVLDVQKEQPLPSLKQTLETPVYP